MNQRLEQLATTDFLTGLSNRRHFEEMAQRELNRLGRNGKMAALIMFDLDHFKVVNDRHGHEGGDEVLRRIREPVGRSLRPRDLCGRSGGEEFVVLLTATDQDQACGVAQRIRSGIEAMRIDQPTGTIRVTASFGVAVWDGSEGLDALIQAADAALYRAKDRGRNWRCHVMRQAFRTTPSGNGRDRQAKARTGRRRQRTWIAAIPPRFHRR